MDLNLQKEQFSVAFVRAVAAVAGVKVLRSSVDDDSIDIGLERTGGCAPKLDLQLKCTADAVPTVGDIPFQLKIKNYDDLRRQTIAPRWLVTLFVPSLAANWLAISADPAEMVLRHCAWWESMTGKPDLENTSSVTVHLPRKNVFTPESLITKFDEIETSFKPI
jgi:hypothetical protein